MLNDSDIKKIVKLRPGKCKIIACVGVIGSGKSFMCDALEGCISETHDGVNIVNESFKDGLLPYVEDLTDTPLWMNKDYESFKSNVIGVNNKVISKILKAVFPKMMTGREVLQRLGTNVLRKINSDIFINDFFKRIHRRKVDKNSRTFYLCTDVRFVNEYSKLVCGKIPVEFIFCNYKSDRYDGTNTHESEKLAQIMVKLFGKYEYKLLTKGDIRKINAELYKDSNNETI